MIRFFLNISKPKADNQLISLSDPQSQASNPYSDLKYTLNFTYILNIHLKISPQVICILSIYLTVVHLSFNNLIIVFKDFLQ